MHAILEFFTDYCLLIALYVSPSYKIMLECRSIAVKRFSPSCKFCICSVYQLECIMNNAKCCISGNRQCKLS